jgi:hypothetical protein
VRESRAILNKAREKSNPHERRKKKEEGKQKSAF